MLQGTLGIATNTGGTDGAGAPVDAFEDFSSKSARRSAAAGAPSGLPRDQVRLRVRIAAFSASYAVVPLQPCLPAGCVGGGSGGGCDCWRHVSSDEARARSKVSRSLPLTSPSRARSVALMVPTERQAACLAFSLRWYALVMLCCCAQLQTSLFVSDARWLRPAPRADASTADFLGAAHLRAAALGSLGIRVRRVC